MRKYLRLAALGCGIIFGGHAVAAERYDDGISATYYKVLQGKKIGFVPISMGFDLPQGWFAGMKRQADALGYEIIVRDPNWSTEAGVQSITSLINEKPDLLLIHNDDQNSYNRVVRRALDANIPVIQINQKVATNTDGFVGADWYQIGIEQANYMKAACGEGSGKSGEIALVQGKLTSPGSLIVLKGIEDTLAGQTAVKVVANQAADWDATKAHAVTGTILKQHPNLCGIVGFWDGQDVGAAAAIREAGKTGQVLLSTSGGGKQDSACDNVANDSFSNYVSYDVEGQARDLNNAIKILLQNRPEKAGATPFALYTPLKVFTKATIVPNSCWTIENMEKFGG